MARADGQPSECNHEPDDQDPEFCSQPLMIIMIMMATILRRVMIISIFPNKHAFLPKPISSPGRFLPPAAIGGIEEQYAIDIGIRQKNGGPPSDFFKMFTMIESNFFLPFATQAKTTT